VGAAAHGRWIGDHRLPGRSQRDRRDRLRPVVHDGRCDDAVAHLPATAAGRDLRLQRDCHHRCPGVDACNRQPWPCR
jgi:hypothetical protein